jgi:ArsR family transcriptional regulator
MNMSKKHPIHSTHEISKLFHILGKPSNLEILLSIGTGEACVCHLEAITGWRQAYISQHLMALRSEGLVDARRVGRNIYYHLTNPGILDIIRQAVDIAGLSNHLEIFPGELIGPLPNCTCPQCSSRNKTILLKENHFPEIGSS